MQCNFSWSRKFQKKFSLVLNCNRTKVRGFTGDYNKLNFPLLADVDKKTIIAYGVWGAKKFLGKSFYGILRTTFIIDNKNSPLAPIHGLKPVVFTVLA